MSQHRPPPTFGTSGIGRSEFRSDGAVGVRDHLEDGEGFSVALEAPEMAQTVLGQDDRGFSSPSSAELSVG